MKEDYKDYCNDAHDKSDREFMIKHDLSARDFNRLYQSLLSDNRDFGTQVMDELQAHVKSDIEAGYWD